MTSETLVFDLETKYLAEEVGGWSNIDRLGLAVGVILHTETGAIQTYLEQDAPSLIQRIHGASAVIGFNLLRFDYLVLEPYGLQLTKTLGEKSIDLLQSIVQTLGFRVSLDNLVRATLGEGKIADGRQSVQWYREGNLSAVIEYCEADVQQTWKLFKYGVENGHIFFTDRRRGKRRLSVNWKITE